MRGDEPARTGSDAPVATPLWIPLVAGGAFLALSLFGCLATGVAAAMLGEGDAVSVSYLSVPLALGGLVGAVAAAAVHKQQPAIATGVPVGCGCATMVVGVVGLVVFYQLIWPSL